MTHTRLREVKPDGLIEVEYVASRTIEGKRIVIGEYDSLDEAERAIHAHQAANPPETQPCYNCGGTGKRNDDECNMCAGTGRIPE
jgi:uncharacterized phage protein